jgi:hypothetical protein
MVDLVDSLSINNFTVKTSEDPSPKARWLAEHLSSAHRPSTRFSLDYFADL